MLQQSECKLLIQMHLDLQIVVQLKLKQSRSNLFSIIRDTGSVSKKWKVASF